MAPMLANSAEVRLPDKADRAAKAEVRKADADRWKKAVGAAVERARQLSGLSLREFAGAIGRDERQIARWCVGEDNPQFAAIFAVESLRFPLIQALGELVNAQVEVTVRMARRLP